MVRFSCFASPNHHHRAKKVSQHSDGAMHIDSCVASQDQVVKASNGLVMKNPKPECYNPSNTSADQISSPSSYWKSEDLNDNLSLEENKVFLQTTCLKKSQSLGCILEKGRGFALDDGSEDIEMEQRFSCGNSCDKIIHEITDSLKNSGLAESYAPENCHEDLAVKSHHKENDIVESFEFSADPVHNESLFFISTPKQYEGDQSDDTGEKPVDRVKCYSSETQPIFARSHSLTNIKVVIDNSTKRASTPEFLGPRSVSLEDFSLLKVGRAESHNTDGCAGNTCHIPRAASYSHDMSKALDSDEKSSAGRADSVAGHAKSGGCNEVEDNYGDGLSWGEKIKHDDQSADGDDFHMYGGLMDEWRKPKSNNAEIGHELQQQSPIQNCDELTSKEFNIKRIEEWISQIDIENSCPLEEPGETSYSNSKKDHHIAPDTTATKVEVQNGPGMEAAHHYISSLTAAASSAQMANLGLIVIPFLGAFVSLRVLNLSGNSIVRITAGALPRGLHMLNLSKNNISTIEGLRELTRLRVLDLSYNRISRIAHGLASCSSLKELYLAGNKISEVEGLHRLLKLNVLDLHFNKISTSKGLGQLAANYLSLQAINLEGNPAQKNVGDEQLKKYLLSLLPNLVYFNKHTTRSVSLKEVPDRSTRSITASDRGMRADHKHTRRGVHGASLYKSAASSSHGQSSNALSSLMKQSKSRHGHPLPATGSKVGHHSANTSNKLLSLKPTSTIRRIQSEGTLLK